jgi:hypothetical protein
MTSPWKTSRKRSDSRKGADPDRGEALARLIEHPSALAEVAAAVAADDPGHWYYNSDLLLRLSLRRARSPGAH